jgi:S1-C subfamily serine protease
VAVPARHRAWFSPREAQERTVTARGDLAADEKTTIELFEKSRASVVYITTAQLVRDVWTRNVFSVPRGTGSGFIWDDAGHVVTNFHVIQGASKPPSNWPTAATTRPRSLGQSCARHRGTQDWRRLQAPAGRAGGHQCRSQGGAKGLCHWQSLRLDWTLTTGIVSALDRTFPATPVARPLIT